MRANTRKPLLLVLGVLIVVLVATRVKLPSGGPRPAPTPNAPVAAPAATVPAAAAPSEAAEVTMLCAGPGGIYTVNQPKDAAATLLRAPRLGAPAQQVATAPSIRGLATAGKDLLYLTDDKTPGSGQLWRAPATGGPPQSLAQGLRAPQGLLVTREGITWAETRPAPLPGIACVPVMQPLSLIVRADASGQGRKLLAVAESAEDHFPGRFLGERQGQVYWMQHFGQQYGRPTMSVSRVPAQGGQVEEVVRAEGPQDAIVADRVLYWTAPSEEMAPPLSGRTVRRMALDDRAAVTLTDWMSGTGRLLLAGQRPRYCDSTYVWQIPSRLGEARPGAKVNLDPTLLTDYRGMLYGRKMRDKESRLVRHPLTLAARLRGLLGP